VSFLREIDLLMAIPKAGEICIFILRRRREQEEAALASLILFRRPTGLTHPPTITVDAGEMFRQADS